MLDAFLELKAIYKGFEDGAGHLERELMVPICIDGCGQCCVHNVTQATTIEAIYAASILTGNGRITAAIQRAEDWLLAKHPVAITYEGMLQGAFASPRVRYEYNELASGRCPFLDENVVCSVWEARPAICRAYGVTRSGEGFCPRPRGIGESESHLRYLQSNLRPIWESFKEDCKTKNPEWMVSGFFPTMLFRAARNKKFYQLIKDNRIATAKVIGINVDNNIMWQPQTEALAKGVFPELALSAR